MKVHMYISSVVAHYITVCGQLIMTLISVQKTCICPRDVVIYKCTVMGGLFGGFTGFRGKSSPFVSRTGESINQEDSLILPHSLFKVTVHSLIRLDHQASSRLVQSRQGCGCCAAIERATYC